MKKKIFILIFIQLVLFSMNSKSQDWYELMNKAEIGLKAKDCNTALSNAEEALKIALNERSSTDKYAVTIGKLGQIYYQMGNYEKAAENFLTEKNFKFTSLGKYNPSYLLALDNLSSAYQNLGRYAEAEQYLKEIIRIKRELKSTNDTSYAKALNNLGKACQSLGKYSETENYFIEALSIKKNIVGENHPSYAVSILNLGLLYHTLGNDEEARENIEKAVQIFRNSLGEDDAQTASAELDLAMVYFDMDMDDKAQEIISRREKYYGEKFDKEGSEYALNLYNLALLQYSVKNYRNAEELLLKSKPLIEKHFGKTNNLFSSCLNSLGIIKWINGKYDESYDYLSQVMVLRNLFFGETHPEYATAMHNLAGLLIDMKSYNMADKYYKKSMSMYLYLIKKYFPFLSETEKARFYSNIKDRFDIFNNYALQRYDENPELLDVMFNYQLATKAVLLSSQIKIRKKILESGDKSIISEFENWRKLKEELAMLYNLSKPDVKKTGKDIDSLEAVANMIEKDLSKKSTNFFEDYNKKTITWKDVQSTLNETEAVVEILAINSFEMGWKNNVYYVALILTKETTKHPEIVIIDEKNEIESKYFNNYKNSINYKIPDNQSYGIFWDKIDNIISDKSIVYVSPDGSYNKININSLLKPNGKYIIEEKNIVMLTNISDLIDNRNRSYNGTSNNTIHTQSAYLFGNPNYKANLYKNKIIESEVGQILPNQLKGRRIPELPGTKKEIEGIKNILNSKNWTTQIYTEENATKSNLRAAKSPSLLHIATHGYFIADVDTNYQERVFGVSSEIASVNPYLRAGLLLAGAERYINSSQASIHADQTDNGILTAYEVINLDLENTDLVVLSACETGLGEIKNGEGVYGLQRAFRVAGNKSLVMSLWSVSDEATQELMTLFYQKWLSGKSKRDALRQTQLELKEKYKSPYYWGAFVMVGE